ncbi:unnamed protein product [Rotaria sp. Silwood2]|nr:unnamed protein product [Rotaria sp. Silwood2]
MAIPYIDRQIFLALVPYLPSVIIVLLIEHIAIAKSFGTINNYVIDPNQELIAVATGSFSRTAIKSKAGVRTPFAGIFTGLLIILAIYFLTPIQKIRNSTGLTCQNCFNVRGPTIKSQTA